MKIKLSGEIASEYNGGVDAEYVAVAELKEFIFSKKHKDKLNTLEYKGVILDMVTSELETKKE